ASRSCLDCPFAQVNPSKCAIKSKRLSYGSYLRTCFTESGSCLTVMIVTVLSVRRKAIFRSIARCLCYQATHYTVRHDVLNIQVSGCRVKLVLDSATTGHYLRLLRLHASPR